jgi:hypothetical protein
VDLRHQAIGLSGNDGKAAPGTTLPILSHTPNPRKGKRLACFQGDPVGHLALAGPLPFVKAIRQDQATLRPESLLEERFTRHRLRPGIDDGCDITPVGPCRPKAPHTHGNEIRIGVQDRGQPLRRRGIRAGGEEAGGHVGLKPGFQRSRVGSNRISAAHIPSCQSFP